MLFTPGIVPGANFFERAKYLTKGGTTWQSYSGSFVSTSRRRSPSPGTTSTDGSRTAASDLERIDWALFDIVGLDYYPYHKDRAEHTKELAPFRRGKANPDSGVR